MDKVTITLDYVLYESVSYNLSGGASDTKHMMNDNTYFFMEWAGNDLEKAPSKKVKEKEEEEKYILSFK